MLSREKSRQGWQGRRFAGYDRQIRFARQRWDRGIGQNCEKRADTDAFHAPKQVPSPNPHYYFMGKASWGTWGHKISSERQRRA
jgi:hypothetical protein